MIHPKHVEQFTEIKNCVTLHLVGNTLEFMQRVLAMCSSVARAALS